MLRTAHVGVCVCIGSLLLACEPDSNVEGPLSSEPLIGFEGRVLECPSDNQPDGAVGGTVSYAVDSMTRKLWRYPTLAERAGLTSVSSCEEAAAYVRAYREYYVLHPDFEARRDPKAVDGQSAVRPLILPHLKIRAGEPIVGLEFLENPSSVIQIVPSFWNVDGTGSAPYKSTEFCESKVMTCSASLIAKNWILTAAHCLQPAHLQAVAGAEDYLNGKTKTPPTCPDYLDLVANAKPYRGKAYYRLSWGGAGSAVDPFRSYVTRNVSVFQMPYPLPEGGPSNLTAAGVRDRDLALLYIYPTPENDAQLPGDVSKGAAATISQEEFPASYPQPEVWMAGYGVLWTQNGDGSINPNSGFTPLARAALTSNLSAGNWDGGGAGQYEFSSWLTEPDSTLFGSSICKGDSGGPLYRRANRLTYTEMPVIYGVASAVVSKSGVRLDGCPTAWTGQGGDVFRWSRVDKESTKHPVISWINKEMTGFGEPPCEKVTVKDYDGVSWKIWQCWGTPCDSDSQCSALGDSWKCKNYGATFKTVSCSDICGSGSSSCSCVKGHCAGPRAGQPVGTP